MSKKHRPTSHQPPAGGKFFKWIAKQESTYFLEVLAWVAYVPFRDQPADRERMLAWAHANKEKLVEQLFKLYSSLNRHDAEDVFSILSSKVYQKGLRSVLGKIYRWDLIESGLTLEKYLQARFRKNLRYGASSLLSRRMCSRRGAGATHVDVYTNAHLIKSSTPFVGNYDVACVLNGSSHALSDRERIFVNVTGRNDSIAYEGLDEKGLLSWRIDYDIFFEEMTHEERLRMLTKETRNDSRLNEFTEAELRFAIKAQIRRAKSTLKGKLKPFFK